MKLSFNVFLKAFSFFSILFFIFGALAIIIGGPTLLLSYEWKDPSIASMLLTFRIIVICVFGSGFVISSLFLLFTRKKGFVAYKRIIDRISSERSMSFNLNVKFPEEDEFGNLGKWLNKFIEQARKFDKIKVERLRASQQKLTYLSESIEKGLIFVSNDQKITYANSYFIKQLKIGNKTIVGLPINKVIDNDDLTNSLIELKKKPKNKTLEDLRLKSGDLVYKTKITIIPIIDSEVNLMETMLVFDYIQKKILPI